MIKETSAQDLARKQIGAVFAGNWSTLERLYADDVQYRDPDTRLSSRAAVIDHLRGRRTRSPASITRSAIPTATLPTEPSWNGTSPVRPQGNR